MAKVGNRRERHNIYVYVVGAVAALAGLLFGYDTGVISGAQGLLKQQFHMNSTMQEFAVSAVLIGTILGAAFGGRLANWLGRKLNLILMAIIFGVGAILTAISPSLSAFIIFRILVGFAIGASSVTAPMYVSEMSPPDVRGALVFLFQFAITVGILVAYIIDYVFIQIGLGWPWMFGVALVPALMLGLGMLYLTETPRWLVRRGRGEEAWAVLERLSPRQAEHEMTRIKRSLEEERKSTTRVTFRGGYGMALVVGVSLAALQQFVGINTIIYYAPIVTGYSGIATSGSESLIGAMIVGVVNVAATIVAIFLVDRVGRRPLLLFGSGGCCLSLLVLGALFIFGAQQFGIFILAMILLYIVCFAIGLGPTYWLIAAEIFPTRLRGAGTSISTVGNWSANLVVSITFLTLINVAGKTGTFWIYAALAAIEVVFVWFLVPETKGKTLEDIEQYWTNARTW